MLRFALGFLTALALAAFVVFAQQERSSAESDFSYSDIAYLGTNGEVISHGFYAGEIRFSSGVTCYVLSNKRSANARDSLTEFEGLGCVNE